MKSKYLMLFFLLGLACKKKDSLTYIPPPAPQANPVTPIPFGSHNGFTLETSHFSSVKTQIFGDELLGRSAISYNGKVYYAGGFWLGSYADNVIDIYDTITGFATYGRLSEAKGNTAAGVAGNKIVIAGGNEYGFDTIFYKSSVDIIDPSTSSITSTSLSRPSSFLTAISSGNAVYFIGGKNNDGYLKSIEIYDATSGSWRADQISMKFARANAGAVNINNIIYIAGGQNENGAVLPVEVYNIAANTWSYIDCPNPHPVASVIALNNKIYVSGGDGLLNNTVDIYDVSTKTWTTNMLSDSRYGIALASANNKIIFFGGKLSEINYSKFVDIYDASNGKWSTAHLNQGTWGASAVTNSNLCLFGCLGFYDSYQNVTNQYFIIKP